MLVSKNSLNVVNLTITDKQVPVLDTVHIREDGGVVAANRDAVIIVSPVSSEVQAKYPIPAKESQEVTLTSDSIKDIYKYIGTDKTFGGILENCDIVNKDGKVEVICYDGKRTKVLEGKAYPEYFDYKKLFERVHLESTNIRVVVNRKRLLSLISTIEKICPDKGDFSPIYFEFTRGGDVIIRAQNSRTDQKVLAVIRAVPGLDFNEYSPWEKQFVKKKEVNEVMKKIPVRPKYTITKDIKVVKEEIEKSNNTPPFAYVRKTKSTLPVRERKSTIDDWKIINFHCDECNNHIRYSAAKKVYSCSFVQCSRFNKVFNEHKSWSLPF